MFFGPPAAGASTPQKTLQAFVAALNRRDRRAVEALVSKSKNNPALDVLLKNEKDMPPALIVQEVTIKKLTATRVRVQYLLADKSPKDKGEKPFREYVEMVKSGSQWLIEAPRFDAKPEPGLLASFAVILADPEVLKRANQAAKSVLAQSNLKQLATAALLYLAEHNDKFSFKPEDYVKELGVYTKDARIFNSPLDPPGTVSFSWNAALAGQDMLSIKKPESTVLFFEGRPGAPNFRYEGKALIAFCNGSVRFITPAQAGSLLWK